MIVVLDTNFLIYAAKYKIDLIAELNRIFPSNRLLVPTAVIHELEKLKKKSASLALTASLALMILSRLIKEKKIKLVRSGKAADEAIIDIVKNKNVDAVATMDKLLAGKIKRLGKAIIKIRQKKYLIS